MKGLSRIAALPRAARLLILTNGISALGAGMVMPFLWIYLTEVRHLPTWVPAATLAVQAFAAVFGGLAYGALLDRLPYNVVVPLANVNAGIGTLLFAFAGQAWVAVAAAVVFGFGISGVGTAVRAAYGATTSHDQRETAYSADYGVLNVAMGIGVILGGVFAAFAFLSPVGRYFLMYTIDAATFFVMAVATVRVLPNRVHHAGSRAGAAVRGTYRAVLRSPSLLALLAVLLLSALVSFGQFRAGLPGYLTQTGAITASGLSFAFAVNIILCAVIQFVVMPHLERFSRTLLVAASGVMFAACWVFVLLAGGHTGMTALVLATVAVILLSIGESLVVPLLTTLLNNAVGEDLRGRANALFSITLSTSAVIGPGLAGALLSLGSGAAFVVVMIVLSVVATLLVLSLRRTLPAERAEPGTVDEDEMEAAA
jgi:MFS family permease